MSDQFVFCPLSLASALIAMEQTAGSPLAIQLHDKRCTNSSLTHFVERATQYQADAHWYKDSPVVVGHAGTTKEELLGFNRMIERARFDNLFNQLPYSGSMALLTIDNFQLILPEGTGISQQDYVVVPTSSGKVRVFVYDQMNWVEVDMVCGLTGKTLTLCMLEYRSQGAGRFMSQPAVTAHDVEYTALSIARYTATNICEAYDYVCLPRLGTVNIYSSK